MIEIEKGPGLASKESRSGPILSIDKILLILKNAARLAVRPSFDRALKVYLDKRGSCEAERELGWAVQAEQTRSRGG